MNFRIIILISITLAAARIFAQENVQPKLVLPIGHTDDVKYAKFSPDGLRVVTASSDQTAKIWDVQSGVLLQTLAGHTGSVTFANFSPDGNMIITASNDNTGKLWDANSGKLIRAMDWSITSAVFSKDGRKIVTISGGDLSNGEIEKSFAIILDTESGLVLSEIKADAGITVSPDGRWILTSTYDYTTEIWDVQNGILKNTLTGFNNFIDNALFSSDGQRVLTKSQNIVKIWDAKSGVLIQKLNISISGRCALSPDGSKVVYHSSYDVLSICDVQTAKLHLTLEGKDNSSESIVFSPDGQRVVASCYDRKVKIWDAKIGSLMHTLSHEGYYIPSVSLSPDGKQIVTASYDETAKIWDMQSAALLNTLNGHTFKVDHTVISPDGRHAITNSRKNNSMIWDLYSGAAIPTLSDYVRGFSPDLKRSLTVYTDNSVGIIDVQSGELIHLLEGHTSLVFSVAYSADMQNIVTSSLDWTVKIWDAHTGNLLHTIKEDEGNNVTSVAFSTDGQNVMMGHPYMGIIKIFDVKKKSFQCTIKGDNYVNSTMLSYDGRRVVTAFDDGETKIWNVRTGKLLKTLKGHKGKVNYAVFSPDGQKVVTASVDQTMRTWDSNTGRLISTFSIKGDVKHLDFSNNQFITEDNSLMSLYNLESGKLLYSFLAIDSVDYLFIHPDGYYDGSEGARELLYFVCNNEVVDLAQMKNALYVPGLVEKIRTGEPINYPKLTELDICDALPTVIKQEGKKYSYLIKSRRLILERAEVYINGKLTFNYPAEQLNFNGTAYELELDEKEIDKHLLYSKENKIKIIGVVKSEKGVELRTRGIIVPATKLSKGDLTPPQLFAVMIGINNYRDPGLNLNYPVKDAMELGKAIEMAASKFLGENNVFMYPIHSDVKVGTGYSTPEKEGIRRALEDIGKKARSEDIVLMFFAGHGEMQGADGKVFTFLTADASKYDPIGISTKELQDWLSYQGPHKMLANKTILIFDACNSGQATTDLFALARNNEETDRIRQVEDLKDKSGMFILAGSAPNQAAYELPQYQQGMLTYSLLSVLKNNPSILDNQQFLNVQKWFLESEKKLKEEVESKGLKQDAKPFGTANIRIGIVDEEVRANINIVNERAVVYCDNVMETETALDNLNLKELLSKEFSEISARGSNSPVFFTTAATEQANRLNILYTFQEDKVVANIRLRKGEKILLSTTLTGLRSDLDGLVKEITAAVVRVAK